MERSFIADLNKLGNSNTTDLQTLALTLPVFESDYETVYQWVTGENGSIRTQNSWTLVADGAQSPVTVRRIGEIEELPQQISVAVGPSLYNPYTYIYNLERVEGGWRTLSKQHQLAEQGASPNP